MLTKIQPSSIIITSRDSPSLASLVNQMPIPGLIECIASDYVESRNRK